MQGCAPLETVVSLLGAQGNGHNLVFKIFKPADLVAPADVLPLLQSVLAGNASATHMVAQTQQ